MAKKTSAKKRAHDRASEISTSLKPYGDIDTIRSEINASIGASVAQEVKDRPIAVVPSGILSMDLAVGNGGLVGGRICDVYGWEGTGKTLVNLTIGGYIQRCQKYDSKGNLVSKSVAFLDAEGTFDRKFALSAGLDPDQIILVQSTPDKLMTGEDFFNAMKLLLQWGIDYIILDSCPAIMPAQALVNEVGGQGQKATSAQLLSEGIKMSSTFAAATGRSIVSYINQKRGRPMATMWQKSEYETGGNALKFYSSYRFEVVGHEDIVKNVETINGTFTSKIVGVNSRIRIIKNKTSPLPAFLPSKNYHFDFDVYFEEFRDDEGVEYIRGVDVVKDFVDTGVRAGVVKQSSSWFSFADLKGNGKAQLIKQLKERPEYLNQIRGEVFQAMGIEDSSGMSILPPVEEEEEVA